MFWGSFYCGASFVDLFFLFMFHICFCYAVLSVFCSLVITCRERAGLLAVLCGVFSSLFSCVYVTFPCGVLAQFWLLDRIYS